MSTPLQTLETINDYPIIEATEYRQGEGMRPARIILVRRDAADYVTAYHCEGDREWAWGHYFEAGWAEKESGTVDGASLLAEACEDFRKRASDLRRRMPTLVAA